MQETGVGSKNIGEFAKGLIIGVGVGTREVVRHSIPDELRLPDTRADRECGHVQVDITSASS